MKVINLFGPPGAGKSTIMLGLTYELKTMGLSAENTPEFIKEMIYEESKIDVFGGQNFILGQQNRRLSRLIKSTDFVITDCPLALIASYTPADYVEGFETFALNLAKTYDNVNYFLNRNPEYEFEKENRYHDEAASDAKGLEIKNYLNTNNIQFKELTSGDNILSTIIDDLIEQNVITKEHFKKSRTPKIRKKYGF